MIGGTFLYGFAFNMVMMSFGRLIIGLGAGMDFLGNHQEFNITLLLADNFSPIFPILM